jgi:hypothetical protein
MLRDQAAVPFGAAGDVGAEPMDDAGQLHGANPGMPTAPRIRDDTKTHEENR